MPDRELLHLVRLTFDNKTQLLEEVGDYGASHTAVTKRFVCSASVVSYKEQ